MLYYNNPVEIKFQFLLVRLKVEMLLNPISGAGKISIPTGTIKSITAP